MTFKRHILTNRTCVFSLLLIIMTVFSASSANGDATGEKKINDLNVEIESIKNEAIELISKLQRMEERLLYPAHTQLSIFLSMTKDNVATPQAISLKIDNQNITHHIYTHKEVRALRAGGIQRLYTGNTKIGHHNLSVILNEILPDDNRDKSEVKYSFNKSEKVKFIEIIIGNSRARHKRITFRGLN